MSATAYPLAWPEAFPRSKYRENGKFKTALASAIKNVHTSLRMFAQDSGKKLDGLVISSNVSLGVEAPADPGVAVWFTSARSTGGPARRRPARRLRLRHPRRGSCTKSD